MQIFNDVMIDLETFSTRADGVFVSIGACRFDINTGEIGKEYYANINWQSAIDAGRIIDALTLQWWFQQGPEAIEAIMEPGASLSIVLKTFKNWLLDTGKKGETYVWGNGASFDLGMLKHAYDQQNIELPWAHWREQDVRTIIRAAELKGFNKSTFNFNGVEHHALDDARHQVRYLSQAWQLLQYNPR